MALNKGAGLFTVRAVTVLPRNPELPTTAMARIGTCRFL